MTSTSPQRRWKRDRAVIEYLVGYRRAGYYYGHGHSWSWCAGTTHGITETEQAAREAVEAAVDGRQMGCPDGFKRATPANGPGRADHLE